MMILELLGPLLLLAALAYFFGPFLLVRQNECIVLERWGHFSSLLKPGLHCFWPLLYRARSVNWRRLVLDLTHRDDDGAALYRLEKTQGYRLTMGQTEHAVPALECRSSDGTTVRVALVFYAKLVDARLACYESEDPYSAMQLSVAMAVKRHISTLQSRQLDATALAKQLSAHLRSQQDDWTENWGSRFCKLTVTSLTVDDDDDDSDESRNLEESAQEAHLHRAMKLVPLRAQLRELERVEEHKEVAHQCELEQRRMQLHGAHYYLSRAVSGEKSISGPVWDLVKTAQ